MPPQNRAALLLRKLNSIWGLEPRGVLRFGVEGLELGAGALGFGFNLVLGLRDEH